MSLAIFTILICLLIGTLRVSQDSAFIKISAHYVWGQLLCPSHLKSELSVCILAAKITLGIEAFKGNYQRPEVAIAKHDSHHTCEKAWSLEIRLPHSLRLGQFYIHRLETGRLQEMGLHEHPTSYETSNKVLHRKYFTEFISPKLGQ